MLENIFFLYQLINNPQICRNFIIWMNKHGPVKTDKKIVYFLLNIPLLTEYLLVKNRNPYSRDGSCELNPVLVWTHSKYLHYLYYLYSESKNKQQNEKEKMYCTVLQVMVATDISFQKFSDFPPIKIKSPWPRIHKKVRIIQ